jgi:hypothetical protein
MERFPDPFKASALKKYKTHQISAAGARRGHTILFASILQPKRVIS